MAGPETTNHHEECSLSARILSGNAIRDQIYAELEGEIASLAAAGIKPGLAAVLVGDNPASQSVREQQDRGLHEAGPRELPHTPPAATISTDELARKWSRN